jgi:hypothetical protein
MADPTINNPTIKISKRLTVQYIQGQIQFAGAFLKQCAVQSQDSFLLCLGQGLFQCFIHLVMSLGQDPA